MRNRLQPDFRTSDPAGVATLDHAIAVDRAADSGSIRHLVRSDIPALVALRQRVFRRTERNSPSELAAYLERVFFDSPAGPSAAHASLVYDDAQGRLAGFLGVIPRRMYFGNRSIRVSVGTQLMVAPEAAGMVGRRLARALCDGPQDLVIADTANEAARRIWDSIGGHTAVSYSLSWRRSLRSLRFLRRKLPEARGTDVVSELVVERDMRTMHDILTRWELRPGYTAETLQWVLEQVGLKRDAGVLRQRIVLDAAGIAIGWFIYCIRQGGTGQVLQVAARKNSYGRLLAHLFRDASASGASELVGRLEPLAAPDLVAAGAQFVHDGPWMLAYTRDRSLLGVIESGRAFLSRLDGEWWLAF